MFGLFLENIFYNLGNNLWVIDIKFLYSFCKILKKVNMYMYKVRYIRFLIGVVEKFKYK